MTELENARQGPGDISCEVCRDLLPLVRDGVASDGSSALVAAHCDGCAACAALRDADAPVFSPDAPNDALVLRRIRRRLALRSTLLALAGLVGGALLMNGTGSVYLVWWLPLVGVLAWFLLRRHWWLAPVLLGVIRMAIQAVDALLSHWFSLDMMAYTASNGFVWAGLTALGCALGALLSYAFGRDEKAAGAQTALATKEDSHEHE